MSKQKLKSFRIYKECGLNWIYDKDSCLGELYEMPLQEYKILKCIFDNFEIGQNLIDDFLKTKSLKEVEESERRSHE